MPFVDDTPLTSLDLISTGTQWNWPRLTFERDWQSYHDGDFRKLFGQAPTVENGLAILDDISDITVPNFFKTCADFYVDAMFTDIPGLTSSNEAREAFMNAQRSRVLRELERSIRWRVIKGRGVLLVDSLGVRAIDSSTYFPLVGQIETHSALGHVFAYPYRQEQLQQPNEFDDPDRIRIVIFAPALGVNEWREYIYSGNTLGEELGRGETDVQGVVTFGPGPHGSFYTDAVELVRDYSIRRAIIRRILNRRGNPHLVAPDNTPANLTLDPKGSVLRKDDRGNSYEYLTYDAALPAQTEVADALNGQIYTALALPPAAFGVDVTRGESGEARERLMFAALSRVNRLRNQIEEILPPLFDAMGAPEGDTELRWAGDALTPARERAMSAERQFTAGLITRDEARQDIGYDPVPPAGQFVTDIVDVNAAADNLGRRAPGNNS